jgi:hypothetical protein
MKHAKYVPLVLKTAIYSIRNFLAPIKLHISTFFSSFNILKVSKVTYSKECCRQK